jgi:hypothetical protein
MSSWTKAGELPTARGAGPREPGGPSFAEGVATSHGWFSEAMLAEAGARINRVSGRVDFPIRWPWLKKPKRNEHGQLVEPGIRGQPVYAENAGERWRIANDNTAPRERPNEEWD